MRRATLRVRHALDSPGQTAALEVPEVQTANALGCSSINGLDRSKSGAEGSSSPSESCGLYMNSRRKHKKRCRENARVFKGYRCEESCPASAPAMDIRSAYPANLAQQIEHHGLDVYLPRHTRKTP